MGKSKCALKYNFESVSSVFQNYWDIPRSDAFDLSQKFLDMSSTVAVPTILEQMQNYILTILKKNSNSARFIDDIKAIEKAKTEFNIGMKPDIIFDELCLKLIK